MRFKLLRFKLLPPFVFAIFFPFESFVSAQAGWFARYQERVAATRVNQPHWATPLITTDGSIEQGLRTDFTRQIAAVRQITWNDGGGKGLQVVPFARTELRFSPPPFFSHSNPKSLNGFGDVAFRVKYRLYGSNEQHHNAIVSFLLGASVPTGKQANGSCCAILTPSLEIGKGFGPLALSSAAVGSLPVTNTAGLGRSIVWNNAIQYQTLRRAWFETEFNTTFYKGGKNDGKQQTFITPGLVVSRVPLRQKGLPGSPNPLSITLGAGEQIALTHFNTYQHALVLSGRLRF